MENSYRVKNYQELLKIGLSTYRRNTWISGALFFMAFILTIGLGLLTGWDERSVYIMAVFNVLFLIGYLMAWVRLEIVKGTLDLLDNL